MGLILEQRQKLHSHILLCLITGSKKENGEKGRGKWKIGRNPALHWWFHLRVPISSSPPQSFSPTPPLSGNFLPTCAKAVHLFFFSFQFWDAPFCELGFFLCSSLITAWRAIWDFYFFLGCVYVHGSGNQFLIRIFVALLTCEFGIQFGFIHHRLSKYMIF